MTFKRARAYGLMALLLSIVGFADYGLLWLLSSGVLAKTNLETLAPDILVGALTTIGFGFIFWRIQKRSEDRQFTRQAALAWSGVRARVCSTLNSGDWLNNFNDAREIGHLPDELRQVRNEPLGMWDELLSDPAIPQLMTVLNGIDLIRGHADQLERSISEATLGFTPKSTVSIENLKALMRAPFLEELEETVAEWAFIPKSQIKLALADAELLRRTGRVEEVGLRYASERATAETQVLLLAETLGVPRKDWK